MGIIIYTSFILNFIHKEKEKKINYTYILRVLSPLFFHERTLFIIIVQFVYNNGKFSLNFHFIKDYQDIYTFINKGLKFL